MPRPASLSFDLLHTFVKLIDNGGDAAKTARELGINQPSMSKRLRYLQFTSPVLPHPWLMRNGKTWKLTDEGCKALPAVRDLISRYDQLTTFGAERQRPEVSFACGRQSALGFVREALRHYRHKHLASPVRISTLRSHARIEGVANGSLDLATVSHDMTTIKEIARRELHVEVIGTDRLALVCGSKTPWASSLKKLPKRKLPLSALAEFPLILPEPGGGVRRLLDELLRKQGLYDKLDIHLEIGGWQSMMPYVLDGMGVGLLSEAALPGSRGLVVRHFDQAMIPPTRTKLICRPGFDASDELDLSPRARDFYLAIKHAARRGGGSARSK